MNRSPLLTTATADNGRQQTKWRRFLFILLTGLCLLTAPTLQAAELDPGTPIPRSNVSSGGGRSSGGVYVLNGSVSLNRGDGTSPSGGAYQVDSGLWLGVDGPSSNAVYLPLMTK